MVPTRTTAGSIVASAESIGPDEEVAAGARVGSDLDAGEAGVEQANNRSVDNTANKTAGLVTVLADRWEEWIVLYIYTS